MREVRSELWEREGCMSISKLRVSLLNQIGCGPTVLHLVLCCPASSAVLCHRSIESSTEHLPNLFEDLDPRSEK